jgi:hypothetical protein
VQVIEFSSQDSIFSSLDENSFIFLSSLLGVVETNLVQPMSGELLAIELLLYGMRKRCAIFSGIRGIS